MGIKILELIPYRNFREKLNLIKEYTKHKYIIEVFEGYIIVR